MLYRYIGTEPCRVNERKVVTGDVADLSSPPDKNWTPVAAHKPPARPEPKKTVPTKGDMNDG